MNKSQLVEDIQNGYTLFKELLSEFSEQQMTQSGVIEKWSIKDTVIHIVVHEQRMIQWITQRLHGEPLALPQPYAMPDDELDKLNEHIYQENRNRALDEVIHDLDATHAEALTLVEAAAEADILEPGRFHLQGGEPLWEAIAANTFWHYEEHGQDIRRWQVANRITLMEQTKDE